MHAKLLIVKLGAILFASLCSLLCNYGCLVLWLYLYDVYDLQYFTFTYDRSQAPTLFVLSFLRYDSAFG
jgi:hypothetical protein